VRTRAVVGSVVASLAVLLIGWEVRSAVGTPTAPGSSHRWHLHGLERANPLWQGAGVNPRLWRKDHRRESAACHRRGAAIRGHQQSGGAHSASRGTRGAAGQHRDGQPATFTKDGYVTCLQAALASAGRTRVFETMGTSASSIPRRERDCSPRCGSGLRTVR
jgi:hypothetical protein